MQEHRKSRRKYTQMTQDAGVAMSWASRDDKNTYVREGRQMWNQLYSLADEELRERNMQR